jgi:hypothetical protein
MALNTTSNFSGKAAGFYISAALKEAKSLDFLTSIENIKFKTNIQKMDATSMIQDATCNFNGAGDLNLTENVLEPKLLMINTDLCKKELLDSWEALQMRAGAGAPPPASFEDYVISYLGGIIADGVEGSIWNGINTTAGQFTGFAHAGNGHLINDATVIDVANEGGAGTAYTVSNIVTNLQNLSAAIPTTVYTKEDLYIYMSPKSYRLYVSKVSSQGYLNAYTMTGDYEPVFEGLKLAVCPGMRDDVLVCGQKSNLFFGTDLLSDHTRIQIMDMANLDGSDNMRVVARYSGGTKQGIGSEIVLVA